MSLATLFISGREWLWPAAAFLGFALLFLIWSYQRAPVGGGLRALCLFLKVLGILALAACLLEPLWSDQRAKPGANFFAVIADNSQGMQIKDRGAVHSRGDFLHGLLNFETAGWQSTLDENFQVRRYFFDTRLQPTRDFSDLVFDGRASAMGAALRGLAERYKGQPLAGVLLLTDGNATDLPEGSPDLSGLPPIYPVVIGFDQPIKDIAINSIKVTQTAFEDAPVSVQADVMCVGYGGANIKAELLAVGQAATLSDQSKRSNSTASSQSPAQASNVPASEKIVAE